MHSFDSTVPKIVLQLLVDDILYLPVQEKGYLESKICYCHEPHMVIILQRVSIMSSTL